MKYYRSQSFRNKSEAIPAVYDSTLEPADESKPRFVAEAIDLNQVEMVELVKDEEALKKDEMKERKNVSYERYTATFITLLLIAAIILVINFVFRIRECD